MTGLRGRRPDHRHGHMLSHPFIQHALIAGTAIALVSGLIGYFVVLRGQVFAGDALSHVAFTGAVAALAAGLDLRFGLFVATVMVGVLLGVLGGRAGRRRRHYGRGVRLGARARCVLSGLLHNPFLHRQRRRRGAVLFGSIFGISALGRHRGRGVAPSSSLR